MQAIQLEIGVLAFNEADEICNLIADLRQQSLLLRQDVSVSINIVANGCTDTTVSVAKNCFKDLGFHDGSTKAVVHDLPQPGKSNAWNEFVHKISSPRADFIFMLDADIRIPEPRALEKVVDRLLLVPEAFVAIDRSEKDLVVLGAKGLVQRLILSGTGTAYNHKTSLAGGFYCARAQALRSVIMPIGLPGEDGFLRGMLLTCCLSQEERLDRLVFVEGVRHIFESEKTLKGVFRHNVRLAIGTAINALLFEHLREVRVTDTTINVSAYIDEMNRNAPDWINSLIKARLERGTAGLLNRNFLLKRFHRLSDLAPMARVKQLPMTLVGFVFDLSLMIVANRLMRRGAGAGFW